MRLISKLRLTDGGSLRVRSMALVLLPLVGLGALGAVVADNRLGSAQAATRVAHHITRAAALDEVRVALKSELRPAYVAAVVGNPSLLPAGLPPSAAQQLTAIVNTLPSLRASTDADVAALSRYPDLAEFGRAFAVKLAQVRAGIDHEQELATSYAAPDTLLGALAGAENQQVSAALAQGVAPEVVRALRDVDLTDRAGQAAAGEFTQFTATLPQVAPGPSAQAEWLQAWGAAAASSAAVLEQASPAIAAQWRAVNATPEIAAFSALLAAQLHPSAALPQAALLSLLGEDGVRTRAYSAVVASAIRDSLAAGKAQRDRAINDLVWMLSGIVVLLIATLCVTMLLRRSVARPLDRLAEQASRISEGELPEVPIGGPREVRTVARALSSSVHTLREIQAQAAAVAAGQYADGATRRVLPGPLGKAVHASIERIIGAITEREAAQGELAHRAEHDALTELPNRDRAMALIEQALHRGRRAATTTAVMFIDLDYFKAVNDTFGHAAGDQVLQVAAQRMTAVARAGDSVARLGGDEFVMLLEDAADDAAVVALGTRVVAALSRDILIGNRSVRIGASVGVAFCRDGYVDADRILSEADAAAYRAKKAGRGRVEVFDDGLREELSQRAGLEQAIAAGLPDNEFSLHYQPIVDLATRRVLGVEALIRWDRPGFGQLAPGDFIPIAEQSALINDIGAWVLTEAVSQLTRWDAADGAGSGLTMAVNISGRHLASNQLISDVTSALAGSGIDPRRLVIDLTERVLADYPLAVDTMRALRALGVQIAIDDFGTGSTSISQLPTLPIDTLKIDRSIVASPDPAQRELVRLIAWGARAFGLGVIAEGVEDEDQLRCLRHADITRAQGFLFARPQPPAALAAFVSGPGLRAPQ